MYSIGIDIGGQSAKCGIVDKEGGILASTVVKTNLHTDPLDFVNYLSVALKELVAKAGVEGSIEGIGVGAPDGNFYTGCIENAVNLTWGKGVVPFAKMLSEAMGGIYVGLTNDANAAAMGEMTYGAARGMKNFIMITLGTGVGSGIVIDGKVVYGHDGFAGELGHTCAIPGGRKCGCGLEGCLEAYTSATGVARTAREWLEKSDEPSLLRELSEITSKDVFEAAEKGDKIAREIFEYTGNILGKSLSNFIAFSAPEAIVLFGGLTRAGSYIFDPTLKAMNENVVWMWKNKVKLLISQLKESDAAILGASALGWNI